jgi:fructan beta-fructosidase
MELYAEGGSVTLHSLNIYPLNRIWGTTPFPSNLSDWTNVNGKWADTLGVKQGRSTGDAFTISGSQSGADFSYQADIKVLDYAGKGAGALVFRSDIHATKGYVANVDALNDVVKLFKLNGNGTSSVIGQYPTALHTSTNYLLKVVTAGDNIQVYLNGDRVINVHDNAYDSGYLGLNVWNSTAEFKDVAVSGITGLKSNIPAMTAINGTWSNIDTGKQGAATGDAYTLSPQQAGYVDYSADITVPAGGAGALVFRSDSSASNAYIANVDVTSQMVKLFKNVNGSAVVLGQYPASLSAGQSYNLRAVADGPNIRVYLNGAERINATDHSFQSGLLGLNVWNGSALFQNINFIEGLRDIGNHDFETGDLRDWSIVSGNAFSASDVTTDSTFWGGPFNHVGSRHLFGFKEGGDVQVGVLKTESFTLGGNGQIDFLVGGGAFTNDLYVALVRTSDNAELVRAVRPVPDLSWDGYQRVTMDAWRYVGTDCYIKVVDQATGGWGHLNIDDVNVPVRK